MQGRRNIETNIQDLREANEVLATNEDTADRIMQGEEVTLDDALLYESNLDTYRACRGYFLNEGGGLVEDADACSLDIEAVRDSIRREFPGLAYNAKALSVRLRQLVRFEAVDVGRASH